MFCRNCGQEIEQGDKFCFACGHPVVIPAQPSAPQPAAEPAPAPVPQPAAEPAPAPVPQPAAEPAPAPVPTFQRAPSVVPDTEPEVPAAPVYAPAPVAPAAPVVSAAPAPKKKKGALGVVAVILVLALVAAAAWFAWQHFAGDKDDDDTSSPETTAATQATNPDPEDPTGVVDNQKLNVVPAELVYEMTEEDVTTLYELMEQCEQLALDGESAETVMEVSDALDDQYEYMDAQFSIATVLYYSDLKDEEASQLYLDCTELLTQAYNDYMEMSKRLYDAEFPAKEAFFEEWTEQDLAMLIAYTPEVMALQQRNSEIEVAYQDMQDSDSMYEDMVPLYVEMVQNNNRIAQIYGYDNYYTYAYDLVYGRDYGSEEIAQMREFVAEYVVDAATSVMDSFYISLEELSMMDQLTLSSFLLNSYDPVYEDEIAEYLATLPQQAREDMLDMFNGNIVMMDKAKNAQEGAFTTSIGPDRSICFFGPGYSSPLTILHEVGHYYGSKHVTLAELPLDLAEVQSQGNEWLFMAFMEDKMNSELYSAILDYKTSNDLATILICVIIDEFEEQVYSHPNVASLTCDDLDDIMESVCKKYGGIRSLENGIVDIQEYWRMVVVEQPVYYISYGTSVIAALNLYTEAQEDFHKAVEIYCSLNEDVDLESGFLGNLETAGLSGPFDEAFYRDLYDLYVK